MYIGISSGEKQPISYILRHFLALQNKTRSMAIGISSIVKKHCYSVKLIVKPFKRCKEEGRTHFISM